MTYSTDVREALSKSLADIEPASFRDRLEAVLADQPLTPGVLTVRTAAALDSAVDSDASAMLGAGVQLSYEGLRLTRAIIRSRRDDADVPEHLTTDGSGVELAAGVGDQGRKTLTNGDSALDESEQYYLDLLAAEVLVSRGFYHLADTGVATQAVEIIRRFGRTQTTELEGELAQEQSLEVDVIKLAVNAGADLANVPETPALTSVGEALAAELEAEPLPDPVEALSGVENRILSATNASSAAEVDRR